MSTLHDTRQGIIDAVGAVDAQTFDHVPGRLVPPALVVLPGSPYIEPGDVFGTFLVRHTVSVVMGQGANETITESTDNLIEAVLKALVAENVSIDSVSTFYIYESNGGQYLAADITVSDNIRL